MSLLKKEKSVTVQDVAREAGVSVATVSRALSTPDVVSKKTRDTVLEAVRATGYRVNRAARNLRKQSSGAVLVLVPNLGNPFFSQILASLNAHFASSGYSVLISDSRTEDIPQSARNLPPKTDCKSTGQQMVDYVLDGRVDGVVCLDGALTQSDLTQIEENGLRDKLVFACEWMPDAPYPSVRSDNRAGARLAVEHLYDLGHRRIAHITGPRGNVLTRSRREGMLEARRAFDLPLRDDWILRGDFSIESGVDAAERILAMTDRPSAVFCASDMVAFGLISRLTEAGISVPGDLSVVGFDDIELAAFSRPALTTIRQDRSAIGAKAAALMLDRLQGQATSDNSAGCDMLGVELIIRSSTARIANA